MGLKGPRMSSGAAGFMSHISMCDAPPHRKNRMVDLAVGCCAAGEAKDEPGRPNDNPANPSPDATSIVRRLMAGAVEALGNSIWLRLPGGVAGGQALL